MITIDFRRPTLEDKELLTSYFRKYPSRSCERTFVNVYLWAKFYQVGYAMVENTVVFRSKENGLSFAYPVGDPKDVKRTIEVQQGTGVSVYDVLCHRRELCTAGRVVSGTVSNRIRQRQCRLCLRV